jgi:hypothetical protein
MAQRADRGIITGVVTDPGGASVMGATVTVRNEGTGVETVLTTNDSGAYTTPALVLGSYSITVNHSGFKESKSAGVLLRGGDTIRQDVTLQIGSVTESVEVKAGAAELNVTVPDVSHTVDEKYYEDLPTVMGADVRLAESLLAIQPGYLPMKPNGDPMFRGSQFNSRINGGQVMATENFFDGAAFGYASGHQQSHESAPPEDSIQEMKVITTSYSAQYGHTSGGFIEYTSKSGTNDLHGSTYEYFSNDALNARGFFGQAPLKKTPVRNNNFGFTLGGPVVIPKLYDGHNKTFFFMNFDWTRFRSGVLPGFGNTTPIDAFRTGDFSSLLTTNQIATDALGRPIFAGQIFDPATTRLVGGVPVRDPFPGNVIPANDPLLSAVAAKIVPLMVHPDRPGLSFNVAGNPAGDQTWRMNARVIEFRVDHSFTPNFRMSESFYWGHRPAIRRCNQNGNCPASVMANGESAPEKNNTYYGNGFYQRIATHHTHTQFDWIIHNNLVNHTTIAWDRWFMGGNPLSAGVGWPKLLCGTNQCGILDNTAGPPLLDFQGNIPYDSIGDYGWARFGSEVSNRWQFSDDLAWVKGKHTLKFGFEYRRHQFPFAGWATFAQGGQFAFNSLETAGYDNKGNNLNGQTGESFASFLLGQVHTSTQTIPVHPMFNEAYMAPWVNDEYKLTPRLTLTLGLRFDYQFARTESHDKYSTFDPTTPNPGAGGIPGALIFAGTGTGRAGTRTFESPKRDSWGPRFGFAYRLGNNNAIRGGYGIYYSGISFSQFMGQPTVGFSASPFAANTTNGQAPAFYWDNGFPQSVITQPPFIDPTFANGTAPLAVAKDGLTLPRYQNWSLTFEHQITNSMMLDVSYIANRGTRLTDNWQRMGVAANMNDPKILALGSALLNSPANSPGAVAAGIKLPYPGFTGNVAQALRPFPQYQNILWRDVPTGKSLYQALEVVVEKHFSHGLQFRVGYTYSKLNNDGAESGQGGVNGGVQNPLCTQACEYGVSSDDVPHVFLTAYTWEIPTPNRFKSGAANFLLGGWNVSGVMRYESGRPLHITMNNDLGNFLFNGEKRPNRASGVGGYAGGKFDPNSTSYFNPAAWTDPGPLQFGNAPRRDGSVRGFPTYSEDASLFKVFPIRERLKLRFESEFGNIFNRVDFCDPNTNWSSGNFTGKPGGGSFGQVSTQCNQPRSIQFALRLTF